MLGKDLFVQGQFQTQRIIKVDFIMVWSRQIYDLGYEQGKQLIYKRKKFLMFNDYFTVLIQNSPK